MHGALAAWSAGAISASDAISGSARAMSGGASTESDGLRTIPEGARRTRSADPMAPVFKSYGPDVDV